MSPPSEMAKAPAAGAFGLPHGLGTRRLRSPLRSLRPSRRRTPPPRSRRPAPPPGLPGRPARSPTPTCPAPSMAGWRSFPPGFNRETLVTLSRMEMAPLVDGWGREIRSLRVSVTDKCNFRCRYCMPAEGLEWLEREELLSFEEIARLVRVLAAMGIDEVRLTGGEPLVRRDLPVLVEMLAAERRVRDLSLTTNGVLLDRLAAPLDADQAWKGDDVLAGAEIRALIEEHWPLEEIPAKASSTARRFRFADGAGEIGFVNPVSEPFCSSCDRIRLTADGQLRTCLFSRKEWDLKTPMREGASDDEFAGLIRFAVRHKELKHRINDPGFVRASRSMSQIGGETAPAREH